MLLAIYIIPQPPIEDVTIILIIFYKRLPNPAAGGNKVFMYIV